MRGGSYILTNKEIETCVHNISIGDQKSLETLYYGLKEPIFKFALSILFDYYYAEDILQETFLTIIKKANQCRYENTRSWIFTITRNLCMDVMKINKNVNVEPDENFENIAAINSDKLVTDKLIVSEVLNQLSTVERQIITLYIFGEMKQTEIAECLDMPYQKIRSLYRKSVKTIKQYYEIQKINN